jgi:hypothetical protein
MDQAARIVAGEEQDMRAFAIISLLAHVVLIGYYIGITDFGMALAYASGVIWILFYLQDTGKDKA